MANNARPLYLNAGVQTQLQAADTLKANLVEAFDTPPGTISLFNAANATTTVVNLFTGLTHATAALNIGTGLTAVGNIITIGGSASKVDIGGDLEVSGNEVVVGNTTFDTNVTFGNGDGTDITFASDAQVISNLIFDTTGASRSITGDGGNALVLTNASAGVTVSTTISGTVTINSVGVLDMDSVGSSSWTNDTGQLQLITTTSGEIDITSAAAVDINATGAVTVDGTTLALTGSSTATITSVGSSLWTNDTGQLQLTTTTSGEIDITSAGAVDINAAGVLSLDTSGANDLTLTTANAAAEIILTSISTSATGAIQFATNGTGTVAAIHSTSDTPSLMVVNTGPATDRQASLIVGETDPTAGGGIAADYGSLYLYNTGAAGSLYIKTAAAATGWAEVGTTAGTTLQAAYNAGQTITMGDTKGNLVFITDETPTVADFLLRMSDNADSVYLATDATNAKVMLGNTAGTTPITVSVVGHVDTDIVFDSTAKNITNDSNNLTVQTTTSGTLALTSAGIIDMDSVGSSSWTNSTGQLQLITTTSGEIDITSAGAVDVNAAGVATINSVGSSAWTNDTGQLQLTTTTSGEIDITSAGAVDVNAAGAITLNSAADACNFTSASTLTLQSVGSSLWTNSTGQLQLITTTSGEIDITSAGAVDINAAGVATINSVGSSAWTNDTGTLTFQTTTSGNIVVNSAGIIDMDSVGSSSWTNSTGQLQLITTTSGEIDITSAGAVDINAAGAITLNSAADACNFTSASTLTLQSVGSSLWTNDTGQLQLTTTTSGEIDITSAGAVDINAAAGDITLDVAATYDIALTAASNAGSDITFAAHGSGAIPINSATAGQTTLATTAQNIVGAINEIFADAGSGLVATYTAGETVAAGESVYMDADGDVWLSNSGTIAGSKFIGVVKVGGDATDPVDVYIGGEVTALTINSGTAVDEGDYIYLDATDGEFTSDAPTSGVLLRVGTCVDAAGKKFVIQVGTPVEL